MSKRRATFNDRVGQVMHAIYLLGGSATAYSIAKTCRISQPYAYRITRYLEEAQMLTHFVVNHRIGVNAKHFMLHPDFSVRYFTMGYFEMYRAAYIETMTAPEQNILW